MKQVKVSVIIPTYKRSECIQRAVDSVLSQTLPSFEIIVVDDNGIDTLDGKLTAQKMKKYTSNEKVIYIQHDVNKNGSAARNTGIKHSRGEYISFLDDDDKYLPKRLQLICEKMDKLDSTWGACYTGYIKHGRRGDQYSAEKKEGNVFINALMRSLYIGSGSNLFFRKSVIDNIGTFDESFKRNQDLEYLVRVLNTYKMSYVDETLLEIFYDIRTVSLSYRQTVDRETNFREKFSCYVEKLSAFDRKKVEIMYDIDWIRYLIVSKNFLKAILKIVSSKIPLKVWFDYIKYVHNRFKNNICYGFEVKL